jgi:hypothetical protein
VTEPADDRVPVRRTRGSLALYALAFLLMLIAGGLIVVAIRSFLETITPLLISAVLSGIAIAAAVASLLVPRRP